MTRAEMIALIDERIAAAVSAGKTCSTMAERIERTTFMDRMAIADSQRELERRAHEPPIPPYVRIKMAPTSMHTSVETSTVYQVGLDGYRLAVGGGFRCEKNGAARSSEIPAAEVSRWRAGGDPEFAALVDSGDLILEPMTEDEARPVEELARRFRKAAHMTSATNAAPINSSSAFSGAPRSGTFRG